MHIIKYCKKEHNINICNNIFLGTLHKYRSIENNEIKDEEEGIYTFYIEIDEGVKIPNEIFNVLFKNSIKVGREPTFHLQGSVDFFANDFHIKSEEDFVISHGISGTIVRKIDNCFMYCMSNHQYSEFQPLKEYDDHWKINENDAQNFAFQIACALTRNIPFSEICSNAPNYNSLEEIRNIRFVSRHRKVKYQDRKLIINNNTIDNFEKIREIINDIQFIKPKKFEHENEYRFTFELTDGKRIFHPQKMDLMLPLRGIDRFI